MVIKVNPIKVQIGNENSTISMKCIPKSYLEENSISELKKLCCDYQHDEFHRGGTIYNIHNSLIGKKNIIIFNYYQELVDKDVYTFLELLNWLIDNIKFNFKIFDKNLKFFENNLLVFNILELNYSKHRFEESPFNKLKDILDNCIEIIYEQFMFQFEKRTATKLVRNYVEYRYNPKYGFCQYIINKQYNETIGKFEKQKVKKIKLN
jgi:hypothetical protein